MGVDERLKWARDRRAWTQLDLARISKVPIVTISRIENQRIARPRQSTVHKLANALGVDPGWLFIGEGADGADKFRARSVLVPDQPSTPLNDDNVTGSS